MDKKKILIIDDEFNFCKLVKKNIEKAGEYEVHVATNGEDGLRMTKEIKPDLILLDVVMPGIDGTEVASRIREDENIEDTPIVFLTAIVREGEGSSQSSFLRGYCFLAKTATVAELLDCIKQNVRRCSQS